MRSKIGWISKEFVEFGTKVPWAKTKDLKQWNVACFSNGVEISAGDIVRIVGKHLRLIDWLNPYKVVIAGVQAFDLLAGTDNVKGGKYKFSDPKNWRFPIYETENGVKED